MWTFRINTYYPLQIFALTGPQAGSTVATGTGGGVNAGRAYKFLEIILILRYENSSFDNLSFED